MISDYVDRTIEQWGTERPDLDVSPLGILQRTVRLATHIRKRDEQLLQSYGLSQWAYEVLAALRRQGHPFCMTPTELRKATLLTSGGMTNRLDRLEAEGWVERRPDPRDGRGVLVQLTLNGRRMVDKAFEARLENAGALLRPLSQRERRTLSALLRKTLAPLSSDSPGFF